MNKLHLSDDDARPPHAVAGSAAAHALLQVRDLSFSYPGRTLLSRWSADIAPGLTLVRGDDGSGKSTLLRLLSGQLPAQAGELRIHGLCLGDDAEAYRSQVFFIEPRTEAFDALTPGQFFEMQRLHHRGFDMRRLERAVNDLALDEQMGKQLFMLSTGSKRKVFLAAAFASGAALTLLDMPFAALDKASIGCVMDQLGHASACTEHAWVVADYTEPAGLRLAAVLDLDPAPGIIRALSNE